MSSYIRNIERAAMKLKKGGRGSRVGIVNTEAKDLLARLAREEKRKAERPQ